MYTRGTVWILSNTRFLDTCITDRQQTGMMCTSSQIKMAKSKKTFNNEFFEYVNSLKKTIFPLEQIHVTFRFRFRKPSVFRKTSSLNTIFKYISTVFSMKNKKFRTQLIIRDILTSYQSMYHEHMI